MKSTTFKKTNVLVLILMFIISTIAVNAQVAVNTSGAAPDASSMLDVTAANKGVLIPRVDYNSISALTTQGLMVYVTVNGPSGNGFYYYDGGWKRLVDGAGILAVTAGGTGTGTAFSPGSVVFAGAGGVYMENNAKFFWNNANNRLGIGTTTPNAELNVHRTTFSVSPAILVSQIGTGDAALRYYLNSGGLSTISTGIDDSDNHNYKISNASSLTGTAYSDANTMFRIHTEVTAAGASSIGITDINHQSRIRYWLSYPQPIPAGFWTNIEFDAFWFDEHGEFTISMASGQPAYFTANEDGYYQVNSRTEYEILFLEQPNTNGYVSIAIAVNGVLHSEGNNLQMIIFGGDQMPKNNAPNVSDVVYLMAGDIVEIWAWQSLDISGPPAGGVTLTPNPEKTYVSIHKIS